MLRSHWGVLSVACVIALFAALSLGSGCSASHAKQSAAKADPASAHVAVFGPYVSGRVVRVGSVKLELMGFTIGSVEWARLSQRTVSGRVTSSTPAARGRRYVDVTLRVRDLDSTATTDVQPPALGAPYVLAGGRRFQAVDGDQVMPVAEAPWCRSISEFELPSSQHAVLYQPVSTAATQVVAFSLW